MSQPSQPSQPSSPRPINNTFHGSCGQSPLDPLHRSRGQSPLKPQTTPPICSVVDIKEEQSAAVQSNGMRSSMSQNPLHVSCDSQSVSQNPPSGRLNRQSPQNQSRDSCNDMSHCMFFLCYGCDVSSCSRRGCDDCCHLLCCCDAAGDCLCDCDCDI